MFHFDMHGLPRGLLDDDNCQNALEKVLFMQHSASCKVSVYGFQNNGLKSKTFHILARKQSSYLGCSSETFHLQNCKIKDRTYLDASSTLKWTQSFTWCYNPTPAIYSFTTSLWPPILNCLFLLNIYFKIMGINREPAFCKSFQLSGKAEHQWGQWGQAWWILARDSSQICSMVQTQWTISSWTLLCAQEHVTLTEKGPILL